MNDIEEILTQNYSSIQLSEIESASLMDRIDQKYVVNYDTIIEMLLHLSKDFKVLNINSKNIFRYLSTYFDTADFRLFKLHHSGSMNRYKIRYRNYLDTEACYFEIKKKDNHGRTLKSRILTEDTVSPFNNEHEINHLESNTPFSVDELHEVLDIEYDRITLVNNCKTERITIDLNLCYRHKQYSEYFQNMAIVEIKQLKRANSLAKDFLKHAKVRPGGISKYCLGIILFKKNISHNRFKHKYNKLYKPYKQVS